MTSIKKSTPKPKPKSKKTIKKNAIAITPTTTSATALPGIPQDYAQTLFNIKQQIQEAQIRSLLAVNKEMIKLYWSIGKIISERQEINKWGSGVIDNLSKDIQNSFPGIKGFSRANIFYMRSFYAAYEIVQKASGQFDSLPFFYIPWWHNIILITKIKNNNKLQDYCHASSY